jgi:hypothetical protein
LSDGQVGKVADVRLTTQDALGIAEGQQELVLPTHLVSDADGRVPLIDRAVGELDHHLPAILLALDREVRVLEDPVGVALGDHGPVILTLDRRVGDPRSQEARQGDLPEVLLRRDERPDDLALGIADHLARTNIRRANHGILLKARLWERVPPT